MRQRIRATLAILSLLLPPVTLQGVPAAAATDDVTVTAEVADTIDKQGEADLWVVLDEQADLSGAAGITDWARRGQYVHDRLTATADRTQTALADDLAANGATVTRYWAANALLVRGGDTTTVDIARAHPEVRTVALAATAEVPKPEAVASTSDNAEVEWGVAAVGAPAVWANSTRGEGVVVASIDTGAQYDHPALAATYRGNTGAGFDHSYNWFDPSRSCGGAPCDNVGHGTHVTGTMAGEGGIGVAPGVRWIAAKGCESTGCSASSLAAAMQWMLAPTDVSGANPRPDLRPHVVNNSWSGPVPNPVFQQIIQAWVAAGIVPVFSAGNDGPTCLTVGSPGSYAEAISVAAVDAGGAIAWFSSRGPGPGGADPVKPDIAAPGVAVRSSVPGDGYEVYNGTSMAAPHVAGSVALLIAAAPTLTGDVAGVRRVLDDTATNGNDVSCGGSVDDNGVYGEGRISAAAAVAAAPHGPVGTVRGTVRDTGGTPLPSATVTITGGHGRTVVTDAAGVFTAVMPTGRYDLTATRYGHAPATGVAEVAENGTVTVDLTLGDVARHTVSGVLVTSDGEPLAGATVSVVGTPLPAVTSGADGRFTIEGVAEGRYRLAAYGARCTGEAALDVVVDRDVDVRLTAADRRDLFGYRCREVAADWVTGETSMNPGGGSGQERFVDLPFAFRYYGEYYTRVEAFSNGELSLAGRRTVEIHGFRAQLFFDQDSAWRWKVVGAAPNRVVAIEWHNVEASYYNSADALDYRYRLSMEVLLGEDGTITMQWAGIDGTPTTDPLGGDRGAFARVGIERFDHSSSLLYSQYEPVLRNEVAVKYWPPAAATVSGAVTDGPDGGPLVNARVLVRGQDGAVLRENYTDAQGRYRAEVPIGTHRLEVAADHYASFVEPVTATADNQRLTRDVRLATGRLATDVEEVTVVDDAAGERTVTVTNTGTRPLTFGVAEARQPEAAGTRLAQWSSGIPGSVTIGAVGVDQAANRIWVVERWNRAGHEFHPDGTPTGRIMPFVSDDVAGDPLDTAYDPVHKEICVQAGGTTIYGDKFAGISCLSPETGQFTWSIPSGRYEWMGADGIAYRPDTDTFYLADQEFANPRIYQVAGRTHPSPGAVLGSCRLPGWPATGLAWNPTTKELWAGTRNDRRLLRIAPDTCAVLSTTSVQLQSAELDTEGRLWHLYRTSGTVTATETGSPVAADQPWLSVSTPGGTLAPGTSARVKVRVDPTGLAEGAVRRGRLLITSDAGRDHGVRQLPVVAARPAYQLAVNAGGSSTGEWRRDQRLTGAYGWTGRSTTLGDRCVGDRVARDARQGDFGYEFRDLPDGLYEVELTFADHWRSARQHRAFDVTSDGVLLLDAYEPPRGRTAVERVTVEVSGGVLRLSFLPRDGRNNLAPIVNGIRVTHRPDRT